MDKLHVINDFLNDKPEVIGAFGYGSGITKQSGYTDKDRPQIDLILAVENDRDWHKENMKANPNDYSMSAKMFFNNGTEDMYHFGSPICYLTNLVHKGNSFKIGVVSREELIRDLVAWKSFYLAGRMQKPMLTVKSDGELNDAIRINRGNALVTALFLLGDQDYTVRDLYAKICSLSYIGDTRMGIAENPNKVMNIVDGGFDFFNKEYTNFDLFGIDQNTGLVHNDMDDLFSYLLNLPLDIPLPDNCYEYTYEEFIKIRQMIINELTIKNRNSSAAQTLKGVLTAGPIKSIGYVYHKVSKRFTQKR